MATKKMKAVKPKSGPKPDTLKIDGDWEQTVKKSLDKKNQRADGRNKWFC